MLKENLVCKMFSIWLSYLDAKKKIKRTRDGHTVASLKMWTCFHTQLRRKVKSAGAGAFSRPKSWDKQGSLGCILFLPFSSISHLQRSQNTCKNKYSELALLFGWRLDISVIFPFSKTIKLLGIIFKKFSLNIQYIQKTPMYLPTTRSRREHFQCSDPPWSQVYYPLTECLSSPCLGKNSALQPEQFIFRFIHYK